MSFCGMANPWAAIGDQAEIDRFVSLALDHYKQTSGKNAKLHEIISADKLGDRYKGQGEPRPEVRLVVKFAHLDDNEQIQCRYHMFGDGKIESHDIPY